MSFLDFYSSGSKTIAGSKSELKSETEVVVREAERAAKEVEAEERAIFAPFEKLPVAKVIKSEIHGISDKAWTDFVLAMKTAQLGSISASNEMGMFSIKPRRLADLGLLQNIHCTRSPLKRLVWTGDFVKPFTQNKFLSSPEIQYKAFCNSMKMYIEGLQKETLPRPENRLQGVSLSGALAILHRAGPSGLKNWDDEEKRFDDTIMLFEKVNGIF